MMLSLTSGEPDDRQQAQIEICKEQDQPNTTGSIRRKESRYQAGRRLLKAGDRPKNASTAEGHDNGRDYESYRLAAAFGARFLCRCRQEQAQAESGLGEGRQRSLLSNRDGRSQGVTSDGQYPTTTTDPAVEAELDRLPTMPIANLRLRYRELFRADPPKAFGPDLLRRSIAHRIQEKAYGGLSASARRLLDQLVKTAMAKPNGRLELPRRIKPGSELIRMWNGKSHRVTVITDGFAYAGETFASLSEIATEITGTRWNGPRFFGLRSRSNRESTNGR